MYPYPKDTDLDSITEDQIEAEHNEQCSRADEWNDQQMFNQKN